MIQTTVNGALERLDMKSLDLHFTWHEINSVWDTRSLNLAVNLSQRSSGPEIQDLGNSREYPGVR